MMKLIMIYLGNGHATAGRQARKRAFMAAGYALPTHVGSIPAATGT